MILTVPLKPIPSQSLMITLNGQQCKIKVYSKSGEVFMDLTVNEVVMFTGILCLNGISILPNDSFNFVGDLYFENSTSTENPDYTLFGDTWFLQYEY